MSPGNTAAVAVVVIAVALLAAGYVAYRKLKGSSVSKSTFANSNNNSNGSVNDLQTNQYGNNNPNQRFDDIYGGGQDQAQFYPQASSSPGRIPSISPMRSPSIKILTPGGGMGGPQFGTINPIQQGGRPTSMLFQQQQQQQQRQMGSFGPQSENGDARGGGMSAYQGRRMSTNNNGM